MKYAIWILQSDATNAFVLAICNIFGAIATALILQTLYELIEGAQVGLNQLIYALLLLLVVVAKPYVIGIFAVKQLRRLNRCISPQLIVNRNADVAANVTKSFQICVESAVLLSSLLAIPVSGILLVMIAYPDHINIDILIVVVLVPLFSGLVLSKMKNVNAVDLFLKQKARSVAYDKWSEKPYSCEFPSYQFSNELKTRKRESYLDESLNVLPNVLLILILLGFMHTEIVQLASFVSIYFIAKIILDDIQGAFQNLAMLIRANAYFKILDLTNFEKVPKRVDK